MKHSTLFPLAAACLFYTGVAAADTLTGKWMIESIKDEPVLEETEAYLQFDGEGELYGLASCNNLMGSYQVENDKFSVGHNIATTMKACEPQIMKQEKKILSALKATQQFEINTEGVIFYDENQTPLLKATKAD